MVRIALRVAATLLLLGAGTCAWIWNTRRTLPYNEQGRYFDAGRAVILNEQAISIYGLSAIALLVIAYFFWAAALKD